MKDYFFTLGGNHFWEDLFVCHGWRIQRNLTSRKVRLLDNWDIIRSEGHYKNCLEDFKHYSEAYEMDIPQDQHVVVMIHDFAKTKKEFNFLENKLIENGFTTINVNYPSMQRGIKGHSEQLNILIDNLYNVSDISFITSGAANIILEDMISRQHAWQKNINILRVIEIDPLIGGSNVWQKLSMIPCLKFVFGPMSSELSSSNIKKIHKPLSLNVGAITTNYSWFQKILAIILMTKIKKPSSEEIKSWCNTKDTIHINSNKAKAMQSQTLCNAILSFLNSRKFSI